MAIDCILRKEIKQSLQTCLGISDDSETTFERLSEELLVFGAVALFTLGLVFEKKALRELISFYTGKRSLNDEG